MPRHPVVGRLAIAVRRLNRVPRRIRGRRGVLALTLAILLGAFGVRLVVAPITIPGADIVKRLLPTPKSGALDVGHLTLRLGAGRLHFGLVDVRLRAKGVTASAARIVITQDLVSRTVAIDGPLMRVAPAAMGGGSFRLPDARASVRQFDAALGNAQRALDDAGVTSITLSHGRIEIAPGDRSIARWRVLQDVTGQVDIGSDLAVSLSLVGADGQVDLSLTRRTDNDVGSIVRATVTGLLPEDFVDLAAVRDGFPINAVIETRVTGDGRPDAAARVAVGQGTVVFGLDPPRTLDSANIDLSLSPDGAILIDDALFRAGGGRVPLAGALVPGDTPQAPWTFEVVSRDSLWDPPDTPDASVIVEWIAAAGRIDLSGQIVHVDRFLGRMQEGRADALFTFDFSDGPRLSGAVRIGPTPIPILRAIWPPVLAYGPREALLGTVKGGVVERVDIDLALTPLELDGDPDTSDMIDGGLRVDAPFHNATFTTPDLPLAIRKAEGALAIRDKNLTARIENGIVGVDGRELRVVTATFEIPSLQARPPKARIRATVEGKLSAVVALGRRLDLPQLQDFSIEPADVSGTVSAELRFETPLGDDVPAAERQWAIDADLTDAGSTAPLAGRTVENADLEVKVNNRRIAARGTATIDGLDLEVNYNEYFSGEKSGGARFVLDDAARRERGIDTGDMLRGPVVVTVEAGEEARREFTADLTEAEIALPFFRKPSGRAMTAEGALISEGETVRIEDLRLEGADAEAAGALALTGKALSWLSLERVALSRNDAVEVDVTREGAGYRVDIAADRFDGRQLVSSLKSRDGLGGGGGMAAPPVTLDARAAQFRLADDVVASNVAIEAAYDGTRLAELSLNGKLDGVAQGSFAARVSPSGSGQRIVRADVREIGRLLSAFGIYERMRGGRTTLDARLDGDGVMSGELVVRDFALTNETTLEAVISRARTRTGFADERNPLPLAFQNEARGAALPFSELTIDFEKARRHDHHSQGDPAWQCHRWRGLRNDLPWKPQRGSRRHIHSGVRGEQPVRAPADLWGAARRRGHRRPDRGDVPPDRAARGSPASPQPDLGDRAGHLPAHLRVSMRGARAALERNPRDTSKMRRAEVRPAARAHASCGRGTA